MAAPVTYGSIDVDGVKIFYRQAGRQGAPVLLLLHGFPSSSHMFRDLIPLLSDKYHVVAPDLPGFGQSDQPARESYKYTFENLANTTAKFTELLGLRRFAVYIFDYGAPVGLRIALKHPDRVTAIITQNGNAYEEGLTGFWDPIKAYWAEPQSKERRDALRVALAPATTMYQYTEGFPKNDRLSPDGPALDDFYLSRPGNDEIQLDLFLNYATNVELYPKFHQYFKESGVKILVVWGGNDPIFGKAGAEAFKRDAKGAEVHLLDAGHFAVATEYQNIAEHIRAFLG